MLSFVAMAPFVVPGIVLAIASTPPMRRRRWRCTAPRTILILAFATRFLPIGYANADAAIRSINPEMEDAVRILGGGRLLAIRRVLAPLMKRSLIGAWLLVFIPATRELSTAMFLYGPKTRTMSVMLIDMSEEGNFEMPRRARLPAAGVDAGRSSDRPPPAGARLHAAAGAAA